MYMVCKRDEKTQNVVAMKFYETKIIATIWAKATGGVVYNFSDLIKKKKH